MFETTNPPLGRLACPMCGGDATVHRAKGRHKRLYYRCYDDGVMRCGTIQPQGEAGQAFIRAKAKWYAMDEKETAAAAVAEQAAETVKATITEETRRTKRAKSRGLLDALLSDDD